MADLEQEQRIAEVLDYASAATNVMRYGFPEARYGADHPEKMGVDLANPAGEWKHIPISRVAEVVSTTEVEHDYHQSITRVRRGEKAWDVPSRKWEILASNVESAWLILNLYAQRGRILNLPTPEDAPIQPLSLV